MIRRKAYSYTRRDGTRVHVPAKLIKGTRSRSSVRIGPLRKGLLGRYGYGSVKQMTEARRHAALRRAVKGLGRRHVERSLTAAETFTKRTSPRASAIFRANERYVGRL